MQSRNLLLENYEREVESQNEYYEKINEDRKRRRKEREQQIYQDEQQLKDMHVQFLNEGYRPITTPLTRLDTVVGFQIARPNSRIITRRLLDNNTKLFFAINQASIWNHVANETTIEMKRKIDQLEVSQSSGRKYYQNNVQPKEIVQLICLRIIFEGRKYNRTLKDQFHELPPNFERWPMSLGRYLAIINCLKCDWETFPTVLRSSWTRAINPGNEFTVDEALFAYTSTVDETAPVRYIPRKPKENGLLVYMGAFQLQNGRPYIIDVVPDLDVKSKLNPRNALFSIIDRSPWQHLRFHVTFDAGFSSKEYFKMFADRLIFFKVDETASVNIQHNRWLYDLLIYHCKVGSWLAVEDHDNLVWSIKKDAEDKAHFLITNAFSPSNQEETNNLKPLSPEDIKHLEKLSQRGAAAIAASMGIVYHDPAKPISQVIIEQINGVEGEEGFTHQTRDRWSKKELNKSSMDDLRIICWMLNIEEGSKDEMVKAILEVQSSDEEEWKSLKQILSASVKRNSQLLIILITVTISIRLTFMIVTTVPYNVNIKLIIGTQK